MSYGSVFDEELRKVLSRRPAGIVPLLRRYFMGDATERPLSKEELRAALSWEDDATEINERRINVIREELILTKEGLREQFQKVASIIALFALMIAFGMNGIAKEQTVAIVCAAAMVTVWVPSPRLKIFRFRRRADAAIRVGGISTQFDEFYHIYTWLNGSEQTLHAAEVLMALASLVAIGTLGYVGFVL